MRTNSTLRILSSVLRRFLPVTRVCRSTTSLYRLMLPSVSWNHKLAIEILKPKKEVLKYHKNPHDWLADQRGDYTLWQKCTSPNVFWVMTTCKKSYLKLLSLRNSQFKRQRSTAADSTAGGSPQSASSQQHTSMHHSSPSPPVWQLVPALDYKATNTGDLPGYEVHDKF